MREPAFGHGLDHHVDVATVVEVAVADDDGVKLGEIDFSLGVLDDGTGPGIECEVSLAVLDVQAARGGELLGNHEAGTGSAHESQFHEDRPPRFPLGPPRPWCAGEVPEGPEGTFSSATSVRSASASPPKYRSYSSSTRFSASISSTGLSSRMRTIRGKRSAKPLALAVVCCIEYDTR